MILKCECGGNVSTDAKQCPHCGKPGPFVPPAPPKPALGAQLLLAIALSIAGVLLLIKLMG